MNKDRYYSATVSELAERIDFLLMKMHRKMYGEVSAEDLRGDNSVPARCLLEHFEALYKLEDLLDEMETFRDWDGLRTEYENDRARKIL